MVVHERSRRRRDGLRRPTGGPPGRREPRRTSGIRAGRAAGSRPRSPSRCPRREPASIAASIGEVQLGSPVERLRAPVERTHEPAGLGAQQAGNLADQRQVGLEVVPVEGAGVIGLAVQDHKFDRHDAEPIAAGPGLRRQWVVTPALPGRQRVGHGHVTWQTGSMSATPLADRAVPAIGTLPEPCVLLKLGEIVLKGGNRQQFERMLQANIRRALARARHAVRLWQRDGVIVLRVADDAGRAGRRRAAADRIAERARDIMGIARVCRAVRVAKDPEAAVDGGGRADGWARQGSFAVRARRRDKRFPMTSAELAIADRRPGPAGVRLPGQPEAPGHGPVRRGRPARGVRLHRGLRPGRAGCRSG